MEARCQCGAVRFKTPIPKPLALYICHCAECRRQSSSAFGTSAIFPRFELPRMGGLACYTRPTHTGQTLYCYFCQKCGTRLIHTTPGKPVVSVKGGCLEGLDWSTAIHIWTKSAMVPIPEGAEAYSEEHFSPRSVATTSASTSTTTTTTTTADSACSSAGDASDYGAALDHQPLIDHTGYDSEDGNGNAGSDEGGSGSGSGSGKDEERKMMFERLRGDWDLSDVI
ncbi:Mss4-like protein [Xylariaceae sp. FL0594]|nr:Mss4-like protein [Xylariaceae sp. FL0594]